MVPNSQDWRCSFPYLYLWEAVWKLKWVDGLLFCLVVKEITWVILDTYYLSTLHYSWSCLGLLLWKKRSTLKGLKSQSCNFFHTFLTNFILKKEIWKKFWENMLRLHENIASELHVKFHSGDRETIFSTIIKSYIWKSLSYFPQANWLNYS